MVFQFLAVAARGVGTFFARTGRAVASGTRRVFSKGKSASSAEGASTAKASESATNMSGFSEQEKLNTNIENIKVTTADAIKRGMGLEGSAQAQNQEYIDALNKKMEEKSQSSEKEKGYLRQKLQQNTDHYYNKLNNKYENLKSKVDQYTDSEFYKDKADNFLDPEKRANMQMGSKVKRGFGRASNAVKGVIGAGFAGVGWLFRKSEYDRDEVDDGMGQLLLFIAIFVHLFDFFWFEFQVNAETIVGRFAMYLALSLLAYLTLKMSIGDSLKEFTFISLIPLVLLPMLFDYMSNFAIGQEFATQLQMWVFLIPFWLVYLMFIKKISAGFLGGVAKFYLSAIFVFILFILITNFATSLGQATSAEGVDSEEALVDAKDFLVDTFDSIVGTFTGIAGRVTGEVDRRLNETLGYGYQADVERTMDRSGVFLENFRPVGTFYENQSVRMYADFEVRSFMEEFSISFYCILRDRSGREIVGTAVPSSIVVNEFDNRRIFCDFEDVNLSAGSYTARLLSSFNYKTSGYSTYYFVPRSTLEEDTRTTWNQRHNIRERPVNIHTQGPVFLGMNESVRLPIPIFENRTTYFAIDYGVRNNQQRGEIQRITEFTTKLPQALVIEQNQCTIPLFNTGTDVNTGYEIYTYTMDPDENRRILAVSCNIQIPKERVDEVASSGARPVTIYAEVAYDYAIELTTSINIQRLTGGGLG